MPRWWLPFILVILGGGLVASPFIAVSIFTKEGPAGLVLFAAWLGAVGWNVYWWCFRMAYRLDVHDGAMEWRAPFARGSIPVASITGIGPFLGLSNQAQTIRADGHRSVPVFVYGDLSSFLARLSSVNAAVPDRVRGLAGVYDRLSAPSPGGDRYLVGSGDGQGRDDS